MNRHLQRSSLFGAAGLVAVAMAGSLYAQSQSGLLSAAELASQIRAGASPSDLAARQLAAGADAKAVIAGLVGQGLSQAAITSAMLQSAGSQLGTVAQALVGAYALNTPVDLDTAAARTGLQAAAPLALMQAIVAATPAAQLQSVLATAMTGASQNALVTLSYAATAAVAADPRGVQGGVNPGVAATATLQAVSASRVLSGNTDLIQSVARASILAAPSSSMAIIQQIGSANFAADVGTSKSFNQSVTLAAMESAVKQAVVVSTPDQVSRLAEYVGQVAVLSAGPNDVAPTSNIVLRGFVTGLIQAAQPTQNPGVAVDISGPIAQVIISAASYSGNPQLASSMLQYTQPLLSGMSAPVGNSVAVYQSIMDNTQRIVAGNFPDQSAALLALNTKVTAPSVSAPSSDSSSSSSSTPTASDTSGTAGTSTAAGTATPSTNAGTGDSGASSAIAAGADPSSVLPATAAGNSGTSGTAGTDPTTGTATSAGSTGFAAAGGSTLSGGGGGGASRS